jgi:hypothetical protein
MIDFFALTFVPCVTFLILKIIITMVTTKVKINMKNGKVLLLMLYNTKENKENVYLAYIAAVESLQLIEMTDYCCLK